MKKIISMGIASAVLALTAIAASATIKATIDDVPTAGGTVTVTIATDTALNDSEFSVSLTGLEIASSSAAAGGLFNETNGRFAYASVEGVKADDALLTLTCTVTSDSTVSVKLANENGYTDASETAVTAEVMSGGEPSDPGTSEPGEPSDPGTSEPGEPSDPGTSEPGEPSDPGTSEPGTSEPSDPGTTNPPTGVALAIVPVVLAGAAVVVAKKRK